MGYTTAEAVIQPAWTATNMFFLLVVPALLLWYAYWRLSRRRMYELAEKLPGPPGLPIIGNALDFTGTPNGKSFY